MTTREIQDEILRLKKEKEVCILAHAYQNHEILEVADYMGDSFALSQQAAKTQEQTILMCGVRFMAETVKVLSPDKKVLLSSGEAGCPMAEQLSVEELKELKKQYPDYTVVAYINTTSELKTLCDVCVTSASAVSIVKKLENDKILFIPDCNLGAWVAEQIPEKTFNGQSRCGKSKESTSKCEAPCPSGMCCCSNQECRLHRKHNWNYVLCEEEYR